MVNSNSGLWTLDIYSQTPPSSPPTPTPGLIFSALISVHRHCLHDQLEPASSALRLASFWACLLSTRHEAGHLHGE